MAWQNKFGALFSFFFGSGSTTQTDGRSERLAILLSLNILPTRANFGVESRTLGGSKTLQADDVSLSLVPAALRLSRTYIPAQGFAPDSCPSKEVGKRLLGIIWGVS